VSYVHTSLLPSLAVAVSATRRPSGEIAG